MPVEAILRAYLDETDEIGVDVKEEEILIEKEPEVEASPVEAAPVETAPVETAPVETAPVETAPVVVAPVMEVEKIMAPVMEVEKIMAPVVAPVVVAPVVAPVPSITHTPLGFSDEDKAVDIMGNETIIDAPKNIERLENIAAIAAEKRKEEEDEDDDDEILTIGDNIQLDITDVNDLNRSQNINPPILNDIEILT
jgi:outer membrane biosynthesis protein TonB